MTHSIGARYSKNTFGSHWGMLCQVIIYGIFIGLKNVPSPELLSESESDPLPDSSSSELPPSRISIDHKNNYLFHITNMATNQSSNVGTPSVFPRHLFSESNRNVSSFHLLNKT